MSHLMKAAFSFHTEMLNEGNCPLAVFLIFGLVKEFRKCFTIMST